MEVRIGIITTRAHARLHYVAAVLSTWWPVAVVVNPSSDEALCSLEYGGKSQKSLNALLLPQHAIMWGEAISDFTSLELETKQDWSATFDPLAAIFFCLSRYEEYQPFQADAHGRFPASASVAFQQGWLREPMAVRWADALYNYLRKSNPSLPGLSRSCELVPTYDVDIAWAYRQRGWRGWARMGLDLISGRFTLVRDRLAVLAGGRADPYDTYEQLHQLHEDLGLKARFFWLLAQKRSRLNPNVSSNNQRLEALVNRVNNWEQVEVGIHPSYYSQDELELVREEQKELERITQQRISRSRQHFLRFRLPKTYRILLLAGIAEEYSMGYADAHGWRAGSHLPFLWYDLELEQTTSLVVYPFAVMDATLRHYLKLEVAEARKVLDFYAEQVRELGGPLHLLWHNSSFSASHGWGAYGEMYEKFLREEAIFAD